MGFIMVSSYICMNTLCSHSKNILMINDFNFCYYVVVSGNGSMCVCVYTYVNILSFNFVSVRFYIVYVCTHIAKFLRL